MQRSRAHWLVAWLFLSFLACKKEGPTSPIRALLPKAAAAALSDQGAAFVEMLPSTAVAFGYLDLGQPLDVLASRLPASYQGTYKDLVEMLQRRAQVALGKLSGAGIAVIDDELVLLVPLSAPKDPAALGLGDVKLVQLGAFTAVGKPKAVEKLAADHAKGQPLYKAQPAWVRAALTRVAGRGAYFTVDVARLAKRPGATPEPEIEHVSQVTLMASWTGFEVAAACKPGKAGEAKKLLDRGVAAIRAQVDKAKAGLPDVPSARAMATLVGAYGDALFSSIKVATSGDEASLAIGWHLPKLPPRAALPPLTERVIAPGEWAVAEVTLGAPIVDLAVALTDVLSSPMDRPRVVSALVEAIGSTVGVSGFNPTGLRISAGATAIIGSVYTATNGVPQEPFPIAMNELVAVARPWGIAVTRPAEAAMMTESIGANHAPLDLVAKSKLPGGDRTLARLFVDVTQIPTAIAPPLPLPVASLELSLTTTSLIAEVVAQAGKAAALTAPLEQFVSRFRNEAQRGYDERQNAPLPAEVLAIFQYHQAKALAEVLTPKVDGDRLRFSRDFPEAEVQVLLATSFVGIAAAVAIPAFMDYNRRARAVGDSLPVPHDPPGVTPTDTDQAAPPQ